jgi:exosortase A
MGVAIWNRTFLLIVAVAALPVAVYWDTMSTMAAQWSTDAYRHGYMIAPVSIFLLWRGRTEFASIPMEGSFFGLALLLALVLAWIVAESTSVQIVEQLAVVLMASALPLTVLGWGPYRRVWFPLAFLVFAVPMGASAVPWLMDSTATIAVAALQLVGVPALREGMLVSLPGGNFEVVEACSGFNYLNAGIALGALVAHLMFRAVWKRVVYLVAVVAVFIAVNGIRAFVVMLVGSGSDMRILVGSDHIFFGWVLFLLAMAAMYWLAERYSDIRYMEPTRAAE